MKNINLIVLTVLASLFTGMGYAQTGQYTTRTISADGKTSTWAFDVVSGSSVTVADNTEDNGILYVNGGGSNKAQTSKYFSFNKSECYIEVPAGSAGSIAITVSSSSDSRWFQLYINGSAGPDSQRLWSKSGDGTDGKKGPQSFTFSSGDITTKEGKTYLHLKTNNSEMKIATFTVTLTTGSYTGGGSTGLSTDATLKSIVYGTDETPLPGFVSSKLDYTLVLPKGYVGMPPTVKGTPNDTKANVSHTLATTLSETSYIDVTAEDGQTKKRYSVSFSVASDDPVTPPTPSGDECAALYPAATGDTPAKGAEVALKTESYGGKIIFADAKEDFAQSFTYTENGLQMNKGGKDSVRVVLENFLQAGSVIKLIIYQSTIDTKERGFNLLTLGKQSVLKAVWIPTETDNERTFEYTVVAGDGIEGKAAFLIQRSNSAVLKAVIVSNCNSTPIPTPVAVESVALNKTTLTLEAGQEETLTATVKPDNADNRNVSWSSDNTAVATVDQNGKVTALTAGTATITVKTEDGNFTATCAVTVTAPARPVAVTGVSLNKSTLTLKEGASETLTATITPSNATNKGLTWSSDDIAVATVTNGVVNAVSEGTATITVKTNDGGFTASCTVTVEQASPSGLTIHAPEIYEESKAKKGYGGTLSKFKNRDYEVYYATYDNNSHYQVDIKPGRKVDGITYTTTNNYSCKANDGWFEVSGTSSKSDYNMTATDEFKAGESGTFKIYNNGYVKLRVKGFDQFSFFGKDNSTVIDPSTASKNKRFQVYVDDVLQPETQIYDEDKIRRYDISSGVHTIEVRGIGASNNYFYGFSLRVADEPLVRHVNGPKTQTVYQTKDIERVAFRVRRAASHRISWKNDNAISGVSLVEGTNDSVFVEGLANAAAGTYTYTIEALDNAGEIKSSESGTITIQTHIFDAHNGNSFTTNIDEAIKPVNFLYYALNSTDIQLHCDLEGLQLTFSKDSIATLTGTPTLNNTEGEHPYTITAAGGNTISGVITLVVPDPIIEPFADAKTRDRMAISFSVTARHAANVTATGLPDGFTVSYEAYSNKATISGTPNIGGGYPKTFNFTLEAAPRYAGKNASTASGKLIVIDPNGKAVLVLSKDIDNVNDDPIAKYLSELHYDITHRKQEVLAGSSYDMFDLILISEDVDADHTEVLDLLQNRVNKPILNMKAFTYAPDRLNWGDPDNGSLTKEGCYITVERDDHPIFQALNKKQGDKIQVLDTIERKGLMPIRVRKAGSLCLATSLTRNKEDYYGDGEAQTFLHEIPGKLSGSSKYICFPIAKSSSEKLTAEGKRLLEETVKYLLNDMSSVVSPTLEMTRFAVNGIAATPNEANSTFKLEIDTVQYPDIDLTAVVPEIELASPYTHTEPAIGDTIDLSIAQYIPIEYVVTDYITRRVYEISLRLFKPQGIETVYTAGEWVNVYDIYGRKVATTNEDIYAMTLPRGIYIIVTESGQTLKIMK